MRVRCPECSAVYAVDVSKIVFTTRRVAKCAQCEAHFYVQPRKSPQEKGHPRSTDYLQSYFEKRSGADRRKKEDRRKKIDTEDLPFLLPARDVILIFNERNLPVGYMSHGQRTDVDRRSMEERRHA